MSKVFIVALTFVLGSPEPTVEIHEEPESLAKCQSTAKIANEVYRLPGAIRKDAKDAHGRPVVRVEIHCHESEPRYESKQAIIAKFKSYR